MVGRLIWDQVFVCSIHTSPTVLRCDVPYKDKTAQRAYQREWQKQPKVRAKNAPHVKKWRKKNPSRVAAHKRKWATENGETVRTHHHTYKCKRYGISAEIFEAMWVAQDGRCAICEIKLVRGGTSGASVAIDHAHVSPDGSGPVRSLLCNLCNRKLGFLESTWLGLALAYLAKHEAHGAVTRSVTRAACDPAEARFDSGTAPNGEHGARRRE